MAAIAWAAVIWAVVGVLLAWRLVPWDQRTFYVGRHRNPLAWSSRWLGVVGVCLAFALAWPCYVWLAVRAVRFTQADRAGIRRLERALREDRDPGAS